MRVTFSLPLRDFPRNLGLDYAQCVEAAKSLDLDLNVILLGVTRGEAQTQNLSVHYLTISAAWKFSECNKPIARTTSPNLQDKNVRVDFHYHDDNRDQK